MSWILSSYIPAYIPLSYLPHSYLPHSEPILDPLDLTNISQVFNLLMFTIEQSPHSTVVYYSQSQYLVYRGESPQLPLLPPIAYRLRSYRWPYRPETLTDQCSLVPRNLLRNHIQARYRKGDRRRNLTCSASYLRRLEHLRATNSPLTKKVLVIRVPHSQNTLGLLERVHSPDRWS